MEYFSRIVDWISSFIWSKNLQLAVLGLQNAGKTTFVNVLTNSEFDQDTIPTIGLNVRQVSKGSVQFKMWDMGGQPQYRDMWERYSRGADCIIFIVDSVDYGNLQIARAQLHKLLSFPSLRNIPLLVLGNKNDIAGALTENELMQALSLQHVKDRTVACYSVSARNRVNIDLTFQYLSRLPKSVSD